MKSIWMLLVPLGALGAAGTASAQPYAAAELGYASSEFAVGSPYNGVIDDRSLMYGLDVGFGFGRRWAIEAGITGYGDFDGRATPCAPGAVCPAVVQDVSGNDVTVYNLSIVPRVTLGDVRMFAKGGYYRARIDTNVDLPENRFTENGFMLGAGIRWYFREPWSISLEATRFDDKVYQVGIGVGWGLRPLD